MSTQEPSPLLTVNQLAAYLSISRRTMYKLINDGEIPYVKVGGSFRFRPSDVEIYLRRHAGGRSREPVPADEWLARQRRD